MEKQFTTYEIALKLKKLGFSEECLGIYYYDDSFKRYILEYKNTEEYLVCIPAPLWQQVIDWLDKKNGFFIHLDKNFTCYNYQVYKYDNFEDQNSIIINEDLVDLSYEEARARAILEVLSMLEETTQ